MIKLSKIMKKKDEILLMAGVLHCSRAFVSPEVLHIDLTNMCNFDCIACWCRSPLLGDKAMPPWERKLTLPTGLLKNVLDEIFSMGGLKYVKLVGGGEPFMHPDILEIVEYIKSKDRKIQIDINTNFSVVDKQIAQRLIELGVDSLTVSIWAGSPDVYSAIRPNQTEATFYKIKEVLGFIDERKKELNIHHPRITIHDVILKTNYKDILNMISFAIEIGAHNIQFVPVDPVKDKTESLLLNDRDKKELLAILQHIKKKFNLVSLLYSAGKGKQVILSDFIGFIERVERLNIESGAYDEDIIEEIPCYVGWLFARIMATGDVVPCCKGHRMPMGNVYKSKFKDIWRSAVYNKFRDNCVNLSKSHAYFSRMGNNAIAKTGCYNCDNLWQNIPMHKKLGMLRSKRPRLINFCSLLLKKLA